MCSYYCLFLSLLLLQRTTSFSIFSFRNLSRRLQLCNPCRCDRHLPLFPRMDRLPQRRLFSHQDGSRPSSLVDESYHVNLPSSSLPMSLAQFLHAVRFDNVFHHRNPESWSPSNCQGSMTTLAIGNQAGDADSIVSALALAYIDSMANSKASTIKEAETVIPIMPITKKELWLRRETVLLLELAGILNWENDLIFVDQLKVDHQEPFDTNAPQSVILVDHNKLDKTLEARHDWRVVEILDHHYDEGMYQDEVTGLRRNIAYQDGQVLVASTCTLVTERLLSYGRMGKWKNLWPLSIPMDLAILLLGVILLDSVNMSPEAGKGTQRDQDAITALLEHTDWTASPPTLSNKDEWAQILVRDTQSNNAAIRPNLSKLFEMLQSAKFDPKFWRQLSAVDALRLDYKQFTATSSSQGDITTFGVSSVFVAMDDFLSKTSVTETMEDFMKTQSVVVLGVMTVSMGQGGNLERELLLCSFQQDTALLNSLADFLMSQRDLILDIVPLLTQLPDLDHQSEGTTLSVMRRFRQGNTKASRKQVVPLMLQYFTNTVSEQ